MATYKSAEYSYPSSPNAERFGYTKAGCWTVKLQEIPRKAKEVAAFATKAEAFAYAATLPQPWSGLARTYFPDEIAAAEQL